MSAALLEVDRLSVDLPTAGGPLHAVRDVSLTVGRGETLCLVGESGCGKSMTALGILDLLPHGARRQAPRLSFAGKDLMRSEIAEAMRGDRIAMIFQEPMTALNPVYTIGDQLTEGYRRHKGTGGRSARDR